MLINTSRFARGCCAAVTLSLALTFVTGCAADDGCSQGTNSATHAVRHLIDLSRAAIVPGDICPAIAKGFTVTAKDLAKLTTTFAHEPDRDLTITKGSQMGTDAIVRVTSKDGRIKEHFFVFSDDHSQWTVEFGYVGP